MMQEYQEILDFWFGKDWTNPLTNSEMWWKKDPELDQQIKGKFEPLIKLAVSGELAHWQNEAKSALAYIILLDQFSRNIYRNTPEAFAQDELALQACLEGQLNELDQQLNPVEKWFFYMPMMHSENEEIQEKSVRAFQNLIEEANDSLKSAFKYAYDFAVQHKKIIDRFGRYPHRNKILGRKSSAAEEEFLRQPNSSF